MAEKYKNVLITGGAGRLGRRVYYNLCKDYNCTLFDQVAPMDSKREAWEPNWKYATFVKGNLNNDGDCLRAVATAKADVILHIGGLPFPSEVIPGTNYKWAPPLMKTTRSSPILPVHITCWRLRRVWVLKK